MLRRRPSSAAIVLLVVAAGSIAAVGACSALSGSKNADSVPGAKQALLDQEQAARGTVAGAAVQKGPVPLAGSPKPISPRTGGLLQGIKQGPFLPTEFQNNDFWQGPVNGVWIQVYAGRDVTGPMPVGELRLFSMPIDPNDGPDVFIALGIQLPPTAEASISIASASGTSLSLLAPSGDKFAFDIASRTWKRR